MTFDLAALDVPPEKVKPVIYVGGSRFLQRQVQAHRLEHCGHLIPERFGIGTAAMDADHEVIRITDQFHPRPAGPAMLSAHP
jgi:hypothetical protein